jgi:Mg-chelatase subunit ChlD
LQLFLSLVLLLLIFAALPSKTVIVNAQATEEVNVSVTSAVHPSHMMNYLLDVPIHGLIKVNKEQCYNSKDQAWQTPLRSQVQPSEPSYSSNFATVQLNVAGSTHIQNITMPIDLVIAIDSSGSMEENDPNPNYTRITAAGKLVDMLSLERGDQSGVVSWDDDVDFASALTSNSTVTKMNILNIDSSGDTDLDTGLNAAVSILDANTRENKSSSSRAILILSDFDERYTPSGDIGSPVDSAKSKGYRIFTIGLNIEKGSRQEESLRDIATSSGGQYYFSHSEENMQAAYENISQSIVTNAEPANVNVTEVIHNYITINETGFSIEPTSIQRNLRNNQTIIRWENISQHVGNNDGKLSADEIFSVNFSASIFPNIIWERNVTLPVRILGESMVEYTGARWNVQTINISQTYINLTSYVCPELPIGDENGNILRILKNAVVAQTNATRVLEDIVLKLEQGRRI